MATSVLLKDVSMTTGKSPFWDESTQALLHVDIECGDVHSWNSVTGEDSVVNLDGNVSFVIPRENGGHVIGFHREIYNLDWKNEIVTVIAEDAESKAYRMSDGKCDVAGRLWAGTTQKTRRPRAEVPRGEAALYCLDSDGVLKKKRDKISVSSGIAWSPDNTVMYHVDSIPRKIYAFDYDVANGDISNERVVRHAADGSLGLPDGMTSDVEGKLWLACFGEGKVVRLDPETGKILQEVMFPQAKLITSCCFGGKNLDELYITSRRYGLTESHFMREQPYAGSIFRVTALGIKGLPSYKFRG
ncbi:regucalcin-like [Liolophura sinensis]|uniref:regucalcin-like n=1 Tax=Liolophura sinensis TaxID=3198878 RepID=UPI003158A56A